MAVKTGIAPNELLAAPPGVYRAIVEIIYPRANVITGADAWQALDSMATE